MKGRVIVKYKFGVGANALMLAEAGALVVHTMIEMCKYVDRHKAIEELNKAHGTASMLNDILKDICSKNEAKEEEEES